MTAAIVPLALYDRDEVAALLGVGEGKIRELVADGLLHPITALKKHVFLGEELIRFCRTSSHEVWR